MKAQAGEYLPKAEPPPMPVAAARFKLMEWIETLPVHPPEASVLLFLAHRANERLVCWPSRGRIALGTKLSERTISRALAALETKQILQVVRERGARGHLRFKEIKLLLPESFGKMKTVEGVSVSHSPCDSESKAKVLPKDSVSQGNIQYLDKNSEEGEIEDKKSAIGQADCTSPSGASPKVKIGEEYAKKGDELLTKITSALESQLYVGVGLLLKSPECTYVHETDGSHLSLMVSANRLAASYFDACAKGGPKARVALWHLLGRVFYPGLPKFSLKHHLTAGQCKYLHQIFDDLEGLACPLLLTAISDWDAMASEAAINGASAPVPATPDIGFIQTNLQCFRAIWFERFAATKHDSVAELEALITRLGYFDVDSFAESAGI